MPFQPEHSLLRIEVPAIHTIDTASVENLFGMWSLFSKASHAMEDGKRLENLSWRLWNRETFCCVPRTPQRRAVNIPTVKTDGRDIPMPGLSTSLDSDASDDDEIDREGKCATLLPPRLPKARPELYRHETLNSRRTDTRMPKHLTSNDLEKMVITIKETKQLEPIELPISTPAFRAITSPPASTTVQGLAKLNLDASEDITPPSRSATAASQSSGTQSTLLESSSSTVYTTQSQDSNTSNTTVGSQSSNSTEMSTHSIVRGFVPGGVASSYRSQTTLHTQPTPILKTSPSHAQALDRKKGAMFTIGTSSSPDESSLDRHMYKSSLSSSLRRTPAMQAAGSSAGSKKTSFREEVAVGRAAEHSPVFDSDDEEEDVSESAIEDEDDSSDWEDSEDQSGPSSMNERELFQRVDSRPQLASRRSLLTTLMHEPDRARALANAASRSTPAMRRSRQSTPNGPSVPPSPDLAAQQPQQIQPQQTESAIGTQPRPIIVTTSNTHQPQQALSPRTTRRNMLSTELTESLRKNLLWERQHRSSNNLAALRRRHTSHDMQNLRQHPEPGPVMSNADGSRAYNNDYFNAGLGEYHARGW